MAKDIPTSKNHDRFLQLGIAIAAQRKMRGLSQEQLAEKAGISRSHLSAIEAPNMVRAFSMDIFFNIADALEINPSDLICGNLFPDNKLK
jgi:transcriptional regulator with XRE-family HTH domain